MVIRVSESGFRAIVTCLFAALTAGGTISSCRDGDRSPPTNSSSASEAADAGSATLDEVGRVMRDAQLIRIFKCKPAADQPGPVHASIDSKLVSPAGSYYEITEAVGETLDADTIRRIGDLFTSVAPGDHVMTLARQTHALLAVDSRGNRIAEVTWGARSNTLAVRLVPNAGNWIHVKRGEVQRIEDTILPMVQP